MDVKMSIMNKTIQHIKDNIHSSKAKPVARQTN